MGWHSRLGDAGGGLICARRLQQKVGLDAVYEGNDEIDVDHSSHLGWSIASGSESWNSQREGMMIWTRIQSWMWVGMDEMVRLERG